MSNIPIFSQHLPAWKFYSWH